MVRGLTAGVWRVLDRDPGLQRVYFDLASQSLVEPQVKEIMAEMKASFRSILGELLRGLKDGPRGREVDAAAVFLIAGIEGLALERLDRGETPELIRARRIFESSAATAIRA